MRVYGIRNEGEIVQILLQQTVSIIGRKQKTEKKKKNRTIYPKHSQLTGGPRDKITHPVYGYYYNFAYLYILLVYTSTRPNNIPSMYTYTYSFDNN